MTTSNSPPIPNLVEAFKTGAMIPVVPTTDVNQLTLPDSHGNFLGAVLRLEYFGVMKIQDQDRERLAKIYKKSGKFIKRVMSFNAGGVQVAYNELGKCTLSDAEFQEFKEILNRATFNKNKFECVRLIGDVLGDRGKNDILMLYLLWQLKQHDVNVEINFSNHDLQFMGWYLSKITHSPNVLGKVAEGQSRSLENFVSFLEEKLRSKDAQAALEKEVNTLIDCYKPMVKLIQYSNDEGTPLKRLKIFNHAPVGIEAIQGLAELKLLDIGMPFDESSPEKLCDIIDAINKKYQELLASDPKALLDELKREEDLHLAANQGQFRDDKIHPLDTPLLYISWNRGTDYIRGPKHNAFSVKTVHGHAGNEQKFRPGWNYGGVEGLNLDFNNELAYSEPKYDIQGFPLGWPGLLNCYVSKGSVAKPHKEVSQNKDDSQSPSCAIS